MKLVMFVFIFLFFTISDILIQSLQSCELNNCSKSERAQNLGLKKDKWNKKKHKRINQIQ